MAMKLLALTFAVWAAAEEVEQITCGADHTCARGSQGSIKCWGENARGQLGIGTTDTMGDGDNEMGSNLPVVDLGTGRSAVEVTAGYWYACARLDDGSHRCWGNNDYTQLGLESSTTMGDEANEMGDHLPSVALASGRTAVQVATGADSFHTCVRFDDGTLQCWGRNNVGQLGLGNTNNMGDNQNEMGDHLPTVSLGAGHTAVEVSPGEYHTCARLDTGGIKCWGSGSDGRLGSDGSKGDEANEMGDSLEVVELGAGRTAVQVVGGESHTCARLDDGSAKCWGRNNYGQLGQGSTTSIGNLANQMGDNLPTISLGTGRTAKALAAGGSNTCAILDNGALKCWGFNLYGQLGLGHSNNMGDDADEMGDFLPPVDLGTNRTALEVAVGGWSHVCARLDDGTVKCWGLQAYLGLGVSGGNLGDEPGEMGEAKAAVQEAESVVMQDFLKNLNIANNTGGKLGESNESTTKAGAVKVVAYDAAALEASDVATVTMDNSAASAKVPAGVLAQAQNLTNGSGPLLLSVMVMSEELAQKFSESPVSEDKQKGPTITLLSQPLVVDVRNLATPMVVQMEVPDKNASSHCAYWNEEKGLWDTEGIIRVKDAARMTLEHTFRRLTTSSLVLKEPYKSHKLGLDDSVSGNYFPVATAPAECRY
ncbi:HERC3 [Symbiodinium pilosum]|uniref:HERC3 protein n=1 Tax=Symbiodinium pilosum TaxID=2952 RepID=A0A812W3B4_SYMPI|nr:HERC3 [Symbiodinium pilosum]